VSELDPQAARDIVRRGYDEISEAYRGDDELRHRPGGTSRYLEWVARLTAMLPPQARVLDLGCGNGVPVSRDLAAAGCVVTGVDFSEVQIERARRLVPGATFLVADMTEVAFAPESFEAVLALYSLIHVPLPEQRDLLARVREWLVPGGRGLLITGHHAWTGAEHGWHGGGQMWWSHADAATYRDWLDAAGLRIDAEEFIPEGDGGHALFTVSR
jgi:2-polyprenyl-3-methyl-5-hydroxy-6-metoxy-1,4-benzoquinol methylase